MPRGRNQARQFPNNVRALDNGGVRGRSRRVRSSAGEPMPDPHANDTKGPQEISSSTQKQDRRTQQRKEGVLGQIEDATYAILRKHENKPA